MTEPRHGYFGHSDSEASETCIQCIAERERPKLPHLKRGLYEFTREVGMSTYAWVRTDGRVYTYEDGVDPKEFVRALEKGVVYRMGRVEVKRASWGEDWKEYDNPAETYQPPSDITIRKLDPRELRNKITAAGTVIYKKQRVDDDRQALELSQEEVTGTVEVTEVLATEGYIEEWKVLDCLPIDSFEINSAGDIRHRRSKALMPQEFDIDHNRYRTGLTINGKSYSVFGPEVARRMWKESNAS